MKVEAGIGTFDTEHSRENHAILKQPLAEERFAERILNEKSP